MFTREEVQTRGGSGPSGLHADRWRKILTSNMFGNCAVDLKKALTDFIK